jgi:hypothetical protein
MTGKKSVIDLLVEMAVSGNGNDLTPDCIIGNTVTSRVIGDEKLSPVACWMLHQFVVCGLHGGREKLLELRICVKHIADACTEVKDKRRADVTKAFLALLEADMDELNDFIDKLVKEKKQYELDRMKGAN